MKRFDYNNEDDDQDDLFPDTGDDDFDYERELAEHEYESIKRRETLDLIQLELVEVDLNQKLLFRSIKMLEKSWFWRFRRTQTKLKMIAEAYALFKQLVALPQPKE